MSDPSGKSFEAQLNQLKAEIAEMARKMESGIEKEVEALKPRLKAAREKLDELSHTSKEAWGDLKPGLERAWAELHKSLNDAAARFKEQNQKK